MTNIMCQCEKKTMGMGQSKKIPLFFKKIPLILFAKKKSQPKQNDILYANGEKNSILYIQVTDETAIHKTVCPMVTDC